MQGPGIRSEIDCDGTHAEALRGALDTAGNFPAVSDEDGAQHLAASERVTVARSTHCAAGAWPALACGGELPALREDPRAEHAARASPAPFAGASLGSGFIMLTAGIEAALGKSASRITFFWAWLGGGWLGAGGGVGGGGASAAGGA